jgi:RNA polymerase sigma factor (sigma-70 family)
MDEEEIHERIIMLDPAALTTWETAHRGAVVGWLVRGGLSAADADEVWNDAFAATVNAAPDLTPRGVSLRRYAFRVARNLRADRMAALRRLPTSSLEESGAASDPYARSPVPDHRRIDALKNCLERCPERYRMVIELAEEGRDADELASILNIDRGSVYQVRHRARLWLQRCVREAIA